MDKLKAAASKAAMVSTIEKGSSTEAPSSVMVAVRCRPMNTREITQDEAKKTSLEATKTSAGQELQQAGEDGGDNTAPIMFNDPFLDNAGDTSRVSDL